MERGRTMRTADEYRASLRDGRVVYYEGQRVRDVTAHPALRVAVDHAALDYEMAADPRHRPLAVVPRLGGGEMSRSFALPRTAEDLLARMGLIEAGTRVGGTIVPLLKEIGTDALFALHLIGHDLDRARGTRYLDRIGAFYAHCRDNDLAMAVAQTDVKGDRGAGPSEQSHPDYYVRMVEERSDGIVVRGAKVHTSVSMNANELIVLPTRALGEGDRAYAVAFAVPVATRGLTLAVSPYGGHTASSFEHPLSSRHRMTALDCYQGALGIAVPDPGTINIAKLHFATQFHDAIARVQEIAGGLLVTAPGQADWEQPALRPLIERYLGGKGVGAEARLRL